MCSLYMKRITLISILLLFNYFVNAQERYEGEYTFNGLKGEASFEFIKGEGDDVIRQGEFIFIRNEKDREDKTRIYKTRVEGFYNEDKKTGLWDYLDERHYILLNDVNNFRLDYNINSEQILLKANYKNGLPDGKWTFEENEYKEGKLSPKSQAEDFLFRNGDLVGGFQYKSYVDNRTHFIRGELSQNGYMNGEWTFVYKENGTLVSEVRNYEDGFLLGVVRRNLETDDIIDEVVYYQTIRKLNLVNNKENKGFRVAEDRFGLFFNDGFLSGSEQYDVQLPGNNFISEFLINVLRYDAQFVNQRGEIIDYPMHTKRFVFELSRSEQRIVEDLPNEFDKLQNTIRNYADRNALRLNRQKSDTLSFAYAFFQFQVEKVNRFSEIMNLFRTKQIQYYDIAFLAEEGFSFLTEQDIIEFDFEDSTQSRQIDYKIGALQNDFFTAFSDYIKQMNSQTQKVKSFVDASLTRIEQDEDLRSIQNQVQERKDNIDELFENTEALDERAATIIKALKSNVLDKGFSELNEKFAKEEDFDNKKNQARVMLDLLQEMEELYPVILEISENENRLDEFYMEEVFNPFTYSRYDQRAKPRLYESGEKLLDYYIGELSKETDYTVLKSWVNKIENYFEKMGELREADTRRLERRINRRLSVSKIESLLEL